ncbi:MAG: biotin transporter BioY [Pseudomonadota bacterium]
MKNGFAKPTDQLKMTAYASLCAALTAVGALVAIPIGPVPIVLQNFFVFLTGLFLGSRWGLASVGIYLIAGILGFPVFAGGTGGIGRIIGPTGGYLVGYIPAVFIIGVIVEKRRTSLYLDIVALVSGSLILYLFGVTWLKIITGMSAGKALAVGMLPFLPGDALKIAAAIASARVLRRTIGVPSTPQPLTPMTP